MSIARCSCFLFVTVLLAPPSTGSGDEKQTASWPQWRGPSRDGHIQAAQWPSTLDEDSLQKTWRVQLGPSYSGPIVAGDRVFITETKNASHEVVRALERGTGRQIWATQWRGAMSVPFFARANGDWIRATPAYDGQRLYVAGMRDVLVCLDAASGERLWTVDFVAELNSPLPKFGFVSSPLLVGDFVFVQAGASLAKLDKLTGEIIWRVLRDGGGMNGSAFSSPAVASIERQRQLLVQTRSRLVGVDLESGRELWSREIPAFRGMNIVTPTFAGSCIFTSSYGGRSLLLDVSPSGSSESPRQVWVNKSQGYMSSPVLIGGHAYLHLRNQRFCSIDLASGKTNWTTTPFGKYWSMVANGDRILALDERGELLLIKANPRKFELVDRRQVSEHPTWAHLAVCDSEIYVRDLQGLSALRWSSSSSDLAVGSD